MWTRTHSIVTNKASKEQLWKLFSDVNHWHTWDKGVDFAKIEGPFEKGNHFILKPKGGPRVKIDLVETIPNHKFVDCTTFPLAKMYGEHLFEETAQGLKITTTMKVEGPLGFLWRRIVAQGIADALPAEMENQVAVAAQL